MPEGCSDTAPSMKLRRAARLGGSLGASLASVCCALAAYGCASTGAAAIAVNVNVAASNRRNELMAMTLNAAGRRCSRRHAIAAPMNRR